MENSQNGNVLWFILLAVALLAALTMVLARGSSTVGQTGDVEQRRIKISQILRYTKSIEAGIQNALLNGCSENGISFDSPVISGYSNARAPNDKSCPVFDAAGMGFDVRDVREDTKPGTEAFFVTGHTAVEGIESDSRAELLMMVPVTKIVCTQANKDFGLSTDEIDMTNDAAILTGAKFQGTYTPGAELIDSAAVTGKPAGCILFDGGQDFGMIYQVLLGR